MICNNFLSIGYLPLSSCFRDTIKSSERKLREKHRTLLVGDEGFEPATNRLRDTLILPLQRKIQQSSCWVIQYSGYEVTFLAVEGDLFYSSPSQTPAGDVVLVSRCGKGCYVLRGYAPSAVLPARYQFHTPAF